MKQYGNDIDNEEPGMGFEPATNGDITHYPANPIFFYGYL